MQYGPTPSTNSPHEEERTLFASQGWHNSMFSTAFRAVASMPCSMLHGVQGSSLVQRAPRVKSQSLRPPTIFPPLEEFMQSSRTNLLLSARGIFMETMATVNTQYSEIPYIMILLICFFVARRRRP